MQISVDNYYFFMCLSGIAGVYFCYVMYVYFFKKHIFKRELEELRKRYEELKPTDPEYNQVRALYTSMMIDAHIHDLHFPSVEESGTSIHSGGLEHSHGGDIGHFDGGGDAGSSGDGGHH